MRRGIPPILCCLALAACGGSSGNGSTSGATTAAKAPNSTGPTDATFVSQLDSVCKRANAAYLAAPTAKAQVAVIQRYLGEFRAVKAPPLLKPVYSSYVAVLAKELDALKRGDSAGLIKLRNTQAGPLVRRLGATGCYS